MKPSDAAPGTTAISRRALLRGLLAAGGLLVGQAAGARLARAARAAEGDERITRVETERIGTTLWLTLEHGPFPFGGARYKDATTAVFVPRHYRVQKRRVDAVLHFHGHQTTVAAALTRHALREQVFDSKQNVVLIVPQGPVNAIDSSGGKLDRPKGLLRFLTEVRRALQTPQAREALGPCAVPPRARIGTLGLAAHSGGYRVASRCLKHGGYPVSEVYLFDALYGQTDLFRDWIAARKDETSFRRWHKLVSFYHRSKPAAGSRELMAELDRLGIRYVHETREGQLSRQTLIRSRVVFIRTGVGHDGSVFRHNSLRDCLFASRFERLPDQATDWFEGKRRARRIDERKP